MLYAIFALLSLNSFFDYFSVEKRKYLFFTVIFFALALLSKEMAVNVIPLSIVIYLLYLKKPHTPVKKFIKVISYLSLTAIIYVFYRFMVIKTLSQRTYWGNSILTTFLTMVYVLKKYLLQLIYPINHNVLPDIALITSVLNLKFILSALFLFTAGVICLRKKNPLYLKTSFLWITLCLIPVSNIIPLRALYAERFLYLSIAGFAFITANLLNNVQVIYRYIILLAVLCLFSFKTAKTNFVWKSNYNLWNNVLRYDQNNAKAHNGIGMELLARNKLIAAVTAFQTAHCLKPNDMFILNNLAVAYNKSGDKEKALNLLKTAKAEGKNKAVVNHNIALFYMDNKKNYKTALPYLLESIRIDKNYANAYNSLGICYANLKDNQNAVSCWIKAIDLMPFWEEAYYNLILFLIKTNQTKQAEKYIETAVKKFPHSKKFSGISKKLFFSSKFASD
ncbi:tetratricopeptide repeat protein, partial [bacterium]|nr:tetratricopeptide repeat protein [bacterium]